MRFGAVAVVGMMVAGVAAAQQASAPKPQVEQQQKATVILRGMEATFSGSDCPGALTARQQAIGGGTVWTTAFEDESSKAASTARPTGLGIHVQFAAAKTEVTGLELRVSYLPLRLRAMGVATTPTNGPAVEPQERAKTFNLDRVAAMRIGGDLLVGPAATITRVHLLSATFADGGVWHAPSDDACSIVPSRMMLVAGK